MAGWQLAETFDWFAEIWEPIGSRLFIIFIATAGTFWACAFGYSYFWGTRKFIRTFKAVELSSLETCTDGQVVRIQGELYLTQTPLIAPFSKKHCAAYETRALRQEEVTTVKGSGSHVENKTIWETIKKVSEAEDFVVKCSEHYALVRVTGSQIKIHQDIAHDESNYDRDRGGFLTEVENAKRKEALEQIGLRSRNYVGVYAENIKFEEGVLEAGEQVAIKGQGKWVHTADLPSLAEFAKQGVERMYEMTTSDTSPLIISDSTAVLESKQA